MTSLFSVDTIEDSSKLFSAEQLLSLDPTNIPNHVAIIMDGNRRWAKKRFFSTVLGHSKGVDALMDSVKAAKDLGVKVLTVYGFSTENWKRSKLEVKILLDIFEQALLKHTEPMTQNGVRLHSIGDVSPFPPRFIKMLEESKKRTSHCEGIDLVLALNYGGRDELRRALTSIADDLETGKLNKNQIDEQLISSYLDTAQWKDPDLLIRTSGENRVSNFLLWQLSYTELYVTNRLWPDFSPQDLLEAIVEYQNRERRLGEG
ncbi:MAG: undecaprenyl diphosphate synthase [Chlamydiales bacterium]